MYIGDYYKVVVQLAHRSSLHSSLAWLVCIQQSENCVHIFPLTQWSPRSSRGCRRNRWKLWPPSTALERAACQHQEVLVLAIRCSYRTNENPVSSYMHESTCSFVVSVEVARAPGVNRRRSAHKTATHISVDLVIVLFRVDVTCHMSRITVTRHNVCCI